MFKVDELEEFEKDNVNGEEYSISTNKFIASYENGITIGESEDKKTYSEIETTILKNLLNIGFDKKYVGTYNLTIVISSLFYIREMLKPLGVLGEIPYEYIKGDEYLDLDNPNCRLFSSVSFATAFSGKEFLKTIQDAKDVANLGSLSNNEIVYSIVADLAKNADDVFTNQR